MRRPGAKEAEQAVRILLAHLGEDPHRDGLRDTPSRVVRAFKEMVRGQSEDPACILTRCFDVTYDQMVVLSNCRFNSTCEHHLLPFSGHGFIGYIPRPGGKVVGLSKLARLLDCYSRRLQIQERLTQQVADALQSNLKPLGVGVILRAEHSCMACRGALKPGANMITSVMLGHFREQAETRAEFTRLAGL